MGHSSELEAMRPLIPFSLRDPHEVRVWVLASFVVVANVAYFDTMDRYHFRPLAPTETKVLVSVSR
jgi:hypothetical protein